jgi:hypothetical protein
MSGFAGIRERRSADCASKKISQKIFIGSWGRFEKNLGAAKSSGVPDTVSLSRLTNNDMQANSGEYFAGIETPWNRFVKGFIGAGVSDTGRFNDEDSLLINGGLVSAYSNTLSPAVTGSIEYAAIDGGYDFLRGPGYKVGVFAGYFSLNQGMDDFGCTPIAFNNCSPNLVPTSGSPVVSESDQWHAMRVGMAGETMLTDRVRIGVDAAYLPWVSFSDLDQHFVGNTGVCAEVLIAAGRIRALTAAHPIKPSS